MRVRGPSPLACVSPPRGPSPKAAKGERGCQGLAWEAHTRLRECVEAGGAFLGAGWMVPPEGVSLVPLNVALFGDRVFTDGIELR